MKALGIENHFQIISCSRNFIYNIPIIREKNGSLTNLSNLPIGKILLGYLMKSMIFEKNTSLSIVQTIPTGLLNAKIIFEGRKSFYSFTFKNLIFILYLCTCLRNFSINFYFAKLELIKSAFLLQTNLT